MKKYLIEKIRDNQVILYLHQDCYNKEALISFIYEFSNQYTCILDKEKEYYLLNIISKNESFDIPHIISVIMDKELSFVLNAKTEQLKSSIVDFAFSKKKTLESDYIYLPFTFKRLKNSKVLVVSCTGEFLFLPAEIFEDIISNQIPKKEFLKFDLMQKNILAETDKNLSIEMAAIKYRSKRAFLKEFTSLHMIVLTKGCNCNCLYCQVSSQPEDNQKIHMSKVTAKNVVDKIFSSPSPYIKIEFQGGEPLLHWKILKYIVDYSTMMNHLYKKKLEYVICSNLTYITDEMLQYIKKRGITLSTSLDGPKDIHDKHRPCRNGQSSYDLLMTNLQRVNNVLGEGTCSPLVTITKDSLPRIKDIVDEYIRLGYSGIFLRPVNPYGNAKKVWKHLAFDMKEFLYYYKEALFYIIGINKKGYYFVEYYTMLLLSRILTPFSTGFVDLQSPSGVGINGIIYDFNGDVFPSDEARMLARTGDNYFKLGNVNDNNYDEIFHGDKLINLTKQSILESLPGCSDCVYQAFCGCDPIRNYVESGQIQGIRPFSDFCKKNKGIFDILFDLIQTNNQEINDVFWSWITKRHLYEVKI
jgi:uncharacterized protein